MDTAAAVIGIPILRTKLLAFAISSFNCGVAGALWAFAYLGTVEPHGFDLDRSFQMLFIIIIGGLGSIAGASWARLHRPAADRDGHPRRRASSPASSIPATSRTSRRSSSAG